MITKQLLKKPLLQILSLIGRKVGNRFDKTIQKNKIRTILIFSGAGIGDILRIFPAIKILMEEFPRAVFYILTNSTGADLFELYPSNSLKFIMFDVRRVHKSLIAKIKLLRLVKRTLSLDLVYNSHRGQGMIEHTVMTYLTGARYRIGYTKNGTGFLYTNKMEFDDRTPILQQNIALLRASGINPVPVLDSSIQIKIPAEDLVFARKLLREQNANGRINIALHPSADWEARFRSWPLANYAQLVKELLRSFDVTFFVLGSQKERLVIEETFKGFDRSSLVNVAGKTSITQMAALLSCSDLFIGNDSGPLHLALALNIPSVALFGATSPQQVIGTESKNCSIISKNLPCSPCYLHQPFYRPTCTDWKCLSLITVSEVFEAVKNTLNAHYRQRSLSHCEHSSFFAKGVF